MIDNGTPSGTIIEKIGSYSPNGTPRQVILNNVPMELIDPFYTVGISNVDWKAECVFAMGLWTETFTEIFPRLTVDFKPALHSITGPGGPGDELENEVAPGEVYDLPHLKGLGDIRFGMHGPVAELAHGGFPALGPLNEVGSLAGDVHFDPTKPWRKDSEDTTSETNHSIARVALHEIGHTFGLPHQQTIANGSAASDNLMFGGGSQSNFSIENGYGIDEDTKAYIKTIYLEGVGEFGNYVSAFRSGWSRVWYWWKEIHDAVVLAHPEMYDSFNEGEDDPGTLQTVTIRYSFMHEGNPVEVDRLVGCCTCCGTQQANMRAATDGDWHKRGLPNSEGHGCYCGCCACKPNGNLHFKLLQCETMLPRDGANGEVVRQECSTMAEIVEGDPGTEIGKAMEFTLSRWALDGTPHSGCYNTQAMYNKEGVYNTYGGSFLKLGENNLMGCRAADDREVQHQKASGFQYTDRDQAAMYQESWGFSGTVCEGDVVPDRPAYTFGGGDGGQCKGMSISASLCCCKTGTDNDYLKPMCYPEDCEELAYPASCWPTQNLAPPQWDCDEEDYSDGDLVREYEVTDDNWKEFRTNPVYKWVAEDTRENRCEGFTTTIEDNGATTVIWTGLHISYFAGHDCPPELRDDFYKGVCPNNSTIRDINGTNWRNLQPDCLKEGFNYDGTRNPEGDEGWSYTDPTRPGGRKTLANLPYPNNPLECSIDCFSFNIRPNHEHYKYEYLKPAKANGLNGVPLGNCAEAANDAGLGPGDVPYPPRSPDPHVQYAMTTGVQYSACSPCTYKQGECSRGGGSQPQFNPTVPRPGTLGYESNPSSITQFGHLPDDVYIRKGTDSLGFCNIVSGQCKDNDPKNPKFFKLLIVGAWKIHCDCQTGVINAGKEWSANALDAASHSSSCYSRNKIGEYPHVIKRGGEDKQWLECISESSCECLGSPSTYQDFIDYDGYYVPVSSPQSVILTNTKYPCGFANTIDDIGDNICIQPDAGPEICWWKSCETLDGIASCFATYRSEGPDGNGDRQGFECTNVSWTTMDWDMDGVPGKIVRWQGIPGKIASDSCSDIGGEGVDQKCWFNYKTCPPYTEGGGSCGSDDIASAIDQTLSLGLHGGLSCGCNSDEDGPCASFCEEVEPVYMFWTGVIEELDPHNEMQSTMCQYDQIQKRFEDGAAYTSSI